MKYFLITGIILIVGISYENNLHVSLATNSTDNTDIIGLPKNLTSLGTLVGGIAAAVGVPITVITSYYQKKQQRLHSMMEVFKLLNDNEHRHARFLVFQTYKEYKNGKKDAFENKAISKEISMVRADFDQIGILIENKLVPKQVFLRAYWNTVLVCWMSLKEHIHQERLRRDYPSYMTYFEKLSNDAKAYWKKHHPETRDIKVY
jgi:hypothetical protein